MLPGIWGDFLKANMFQDGVLADRNKAVICSKFHRRNLEPANIEYKLSIVNE